MNACRFIVGCLIAIAAVGARAVDVSGTYENAGAMVKPGTAAETGVISLQGLLSLEFEYELTRVKHEQVDRVVVRQSDPAFVIECKDRDDAVTWSGRWDRGVGYDVDPGQVNLLIRSKNLKSDGFLFSLSLAGDGQLLLVDVRRINTTTFGPVAKPIGVFVFNRVPGKSPKSSKQPG